MGDPASKASRNFIGAATTQRASPRSRGRARSPEPCQEEPRAPPGIERPRESIRSHCRHLVPSRRGAQAGPRELGAWYPKGGKIERKGPIAGSQEEGQPAKLLGHQPLQRSLQGAGSRAASAPPERITPIRFLGARLVGGLRVRGMGPPDARGAPRDPAVMEASAPGPLHRGGGGELRGKMGQEEAPKSQTACEPSARKSPWVVGIVPAART